MINKLNSNKQCFVCGKVVGKNPSLAVTIDGQIVDVGRECFKYIVAAGEEGWSCPDNPELVLFTLDDAPDEAIQAVPIEYRHRFK